MSFKIIFLNRIKELKEQGLVNYQEFNDLKKEILNSTEDDNERLNLIIINKEKGHNNYTQNEDSSNFEYSNEDSLTKRDNIKPSNKNNRVLLVNFGIVIIVLGVIASGIIMLNKYNHENANSSAVNTNTTKVDSVPKAEVVSVNSSYIASDNVVFYLKKNERYILVDSLTMKPINGIEYDNLSEFRDGLAEVRRDGKNGVVNNSGLEIVPCGMYDVSYNDNLGYAKIIVRDKIQSNTSLSGFVDKLGKTIIPPIYSSIDPFHQGVAKFYQSGCGAKDAHWGFVNAHGNEIVSCRYSDAHDFNEGLAAVRKPLAEGWGWGFIDSTGKEVIETRFNEADDFYEGLAKVSLKSNGYYGYINKRGEVVIQPNFIKASIFSEGLAVVSDYYGNQVIDANGVALSQFKNKNYKCMGNFSGGLVKIKEGFFWGFANKNGDKIMPTIYQFVSDFNDGLCRVSVNSTELPPFLFLNNLGNVVFKTDHFINDFHEGLALVQINEGSKSHVGYMNKEGNLSIPTRYRLINGRGDFHNGFAKVSDDLHRKEFLIDKDGRNYCDP